MEGAGLVCASHTHRALLDAMQAALALFDEPSHYAALRRNAYAYALFARLASRFCICRSSRWYWSAMSSAWIRSTVCKLTRDFSLGAS